MKRFLFYCLGMLLLGVLGCESDLEKVVMKPSTAPAVTLSSASVVLSESTATDTVASIAWTPADYGFKAAVKYTVQIAKAGTNFANPLEVSTGPSTRLKYTGAELNQLALIRGLAPANAGQLDIRVKSTLTDEQIVYSEKSTLTVTPYLVIINYPSLWVPGDYQGWSPETAPKISSRQSNGAYEGYVNIKPGTLQFKFTSHPNWNNTNYGLVSSTVEGDNIKGKISTSGDNLFVPAAGYYLIKANTNDNSWSATKISGWGLIGDFNGWSTDVNMTYDAEKNVWTATINPSANGGFKFRANGGWDINLGDSGGDLILDYGGDNIPVTAGPKTITLNLSSPGNYTYKIQ